MRDVYIFDLDGTLADNTHRASHLNTRPIDWDAFFRDIGLDTPISFGAHFFRMLAEGRPDNCALAVLTARPERCRMQTSWWLRVHRLQPDHLLMRGDNDHRDDVDVKRDMLAELRERHKLRPVFALEDRAPIVRMYRDAGLICYHVADGGEF
jgi:hypothetical protein